MARKQSKELGANDALEKLRAALNQQVVEPNIYAYRPLPKQSAFHKADKHTRLYIGGNRSGKTVAGVVEDIYWLKGQHPHRKIPEKQIRGRVHTVDFKNGFEKIIQPKFKQWMPPSLLINGSWEDSFDKQGRTLNCSNGNFVEFMSYDQDLDKFAGTSRDFCHYDEEPPRHIYNESQARLIDVDGYAWLTMTPVDGMTWVYHELYVPGLSGADDDVAVVEVDMGENTYLTEAARRRYLRSLDPDERAAREHGHFMQMGGLVFRVFNPEIHVVPDFVPPTNWEFYSSVDHGYNNPTAWLWHAVSPDGDVVTFSEHYASEMLVSQHSTTVHMREAGFQRIPDMRICDPALAQRQGVTGDSIIEEYAKHGIFLMPGNNDVPTGVNKMNQYLKPDHNGKVRWTITESCVNLIREMRLLRWATYASKKMQYENNKHEKIHKKDDHAPDSARYFFTFMPDLAPVEDKPKGLQRTPNPEGSVGGIQPGTKSDPNLERRIQQTQRSKNPNWEVFEGTDLYAMEFE